MSETWNVTIVVEGDDDEITACARLRGGTALGHVVGRGSCSTTPTPLQDPRELVVVRALVDLTRQLDLVLGTHQVREDLRA